MSTPGRPSRRRSHVIRGAWSVVGLLVFAICALGASLSPWVLLAFEALAVSIVDLVGLSALERRTGRHTATRCAVIGLAALVIQATGLYLSAYVEGTVLASDGSGSLFWTFPAMAALLSAWLLVRRATRLYGWVVLIGSAQGFLAFVAFLVAVFTACDCLD